MANPSKENFIILPVQRIEQANNGTVFIGKIRFEDLREVYKYTERVEDTDTTEFGLPNIELNEKVRKETEEFQRELDPKRVNGIASYILTALVLKNDHFALFPTSMILYNRCLENDELINPKYDNDGELTEETILSSYSKEMSSCLYRKKIIDGNEYYTLYVPKNPNITLVVDGQHRLESLIALDKKIKNEYEKLLKPYIDKGYDISKDGLLDSINKFEFIITYLVDFDIYNVGKIFADVNFKQKPVNKSLYYDIFGSIPNYTDDDAENEIKLAHNLTVYLNNNAGSPLKDKIKLLGKGDGFLSQAFFVDKYRRFAMNPKNGVWNRYTSMYRVGDTGYSILGEFMIAYMQSIETSLKEFWPSESIKRARDYKNGNVLKTTGMGALLRLIKNIFPKIENENKEKWREILVQEFSKLSEEDKQRLFGPEGDFFGAGSESMQGKLYNQLKAKLGY